MKDHEIIALFFERSERAITELINKYGAAIKNVASNILKDAQDAEEAVSDTYLTVWNRIPPAKPKYLGAYSCRIARNLSLKCFYANTAQKRNSYYDVALDELEETIPAWKRSQWNRGKSNEKAITRWKQTKRFARLVDVPFPEELENLAQKAIFSQHRIQREELQLFEFFRETLLEAANRKPWYHRILLRWIFAIGS